MDSTPTKTGKGGGSVLFKEAVTKSRAARAAVALQQHTATGVRPTTMVVGSGASAVHFAQTALERGWEVTMLDVGRPHAEAERPDDSFQKLKQRLDDPATYFLGERFEGVLFPGVAGEYYGFPPHKARLFDPLEQFPLSTQGLDPLVSFARGGLSQAWTGAAFPFNQAELADFPSAARELEPYYDLVAGRIGVSGSADDLERFVPVHAHLSEPLDLDEHSSELLASYKRHREWLHEHMGMWMGRSRCATLREDHGDRQGCTNLGRCLWGCPRQALYTPSITLRQLQTMRGFTYVPGVFVEHVEIGPGGRAIGVTATRIGNGASERFNADRVVLAAGTLASGRIVLATFARMGIPPILRGLMDNRQVLVPFVNLRMLRRPHDPDSYQYHQLALGLAMEPRMHYVHGLITTLKTAMIHPIVQSLPLDLRSALFVFGNAHAALGIVNVNFHDTRREENVLQLDTSKSGRTPLLVQYRPAADEPERMRAVLRRVKRALRKLGCFVPPGMSHVRPMGASVHYAGTLPMSDTGAPSSTSSACESREVPGLYIADGSTLPFLPAKNLTFTLMANAARIADVAF